MYSYDRWSLRTVLAKPSAQGSQCSNRDKRIRTLVNQDSLDIKAQVIPLDTSRPLPKSFQGFKPSVMNASPPNHQATYIRAAPDTGRDNVQESYTHAGRNAHTSGNSTHQREGTPWH